MKRVILSDTVKFICKTQQDVDNLLAMGYKIKKTKEGVEYLIRKEN